MNSLLILLSIFSITSCFANKKLELQTKSKQIITSAKLSSEEDRIISVYEKSVQSVVNVSNIKISDSFFYGRVEVPQGAGTGFIWDSEGHIVTNYHVVQGGDSFVVTFHNDKKQYKAKVVGVAPNKDIAVLKLQDRPNSLKPISIGVSKSLRVGQTALALGNPFGLDHSLSKGIISAVGRKIQGIGGVKIHDMIQTDAAINQGNSGGPLMNSSGQVIGMNTMIFSTSGSSSGLGFAVPVDIISQFVPQLIEFGKVIRPGLGIGLLEDDARRRYVGESGAAISFVDPDGAAAKAGLRGMMRDRYGRIYIGDVIIKINKKKVTTKDDIFQILENYKIGDTIDIEYLRKDKKQKTKLTLQEL